MKNFNYTAEEVQQEFNESKPQYGLMFKKIKLQLILLKDKALATKNKVDIDTLNSIEATLEKLAKQKAEMDSEIAELKNELAKGK